MNPELQNMYRQLKLSDEVLNYCSDIEEGLKERFEEIDRVAEYNQMKVITAMQKNQLSDIHFAATTGYGYNVTPLTIFRIRSTSPPKSA